MGVKRQKNQWGLAFSAEGRGEAPRAAGEGTETPVAKPQSESPAEAERLMEEVVKRENLEKAYKRVKANRGSPGVDGMTVAALGEHLKEHWPEVREGLLGGTYRPQPVRRVEIPKADGGKRRLGIPTVVDRFIQQAVLQVLQKRLDPTFSEHSYGFRPGRSAHQAVAQAQAYIAAGCGIVVDLDLEKFFDRVNHDVLMGLLAKRVEDQRVLKLIRAYLDAGALEDGLVSPREEGTPQGGPLSPLLSNVVLDVLDRELERRSLRFVRYADDCNVYVRSERAGRRVMEGVKRFIAKRLKLKVNEAKSAVDRPQRRKFLGFSFTSEAAPKRRIAPQAVQRFKERVREVTRRTRKGLEGTIEELTRYLKGWVGYFGYCQTRSVLRELDSWIRRRLRRLAWRYWKRGKTRYRELLRRGVGRELAAQTAGSAKGPWRLAKSPALSLALPNAYLKSLGLPNLSAHCAV
ncbi:MAG: group II intron reverse transcriptase/maturase [Myxococcales bacterium]|nr:MAG: group II intron reverse transcriptase/maturase [Myxococcales bacterium]